MSGDAAKELPEEHREAFKRLKAEGKFVIGYFGSHELSYGLHNLLDVTKQLSDENVHLVMVGKGKLKDEAYKLCGAEWNQQRDILTSSRKGNNPCSYR